VDHLREGKAAPHLDPRHVYGISSIGFGIIDPKHYAGNSWKFDQYFHVFSSDNLAKTLMLKTIVVSGNAPRQSYPKRTNIRLHLWHASRSKTPIAERYFSLKKMEETNLNPRAASSLYGTCRIRANIGLFQGIGPRVL
jgi:hypothetical protein